jgi:hypothetical protein
LTIPRGWQHQAGSYLFLRFDPVDFSCRFRQISPPFGVARVVGGQLLKAVQTGLVLVAGSAQITGRDRHIPEPFAADRQIPLPSGVAWVGGSQPLDDF